MSAPDVVQGSLDFDGPAYVPELDRARLGAQGDAVRDLMADGAWRTLREIADAVRAPESSVSAQLRHLRKPRFGAFLVHRRRRGDERGGLFEYRVEARS